MLASMKRIVAIAVAALVVFGCRETKVEVAEPPVADAGHRAQVEQWKARRAERLKAEDGWLSLIGLFWLDEGKNVVSIPSSSVPRPLDIVRKGDSVTLQAFAPMAIGGDAVTGPIQLLSDASENGPTVVQIGSVRFQVIRRGDRYGLRVKDAQARTLTEFKGLEYYPIDPKWRVQARFFPYNPPKNIPITDVTGMTSDNPSPGVLVFTVDGREYRLDPIDEGGEELFVIFKDTTSRDETYPAGRYLYIPKPGADGQAVLDFNKAYNPPCAFTPFATCPLPPPQNRLDLRIDAGEKKYAEH